MNVLIQRLHQLAALLGRQDLVGFDEKQLPAALRTAIDEHRALKEAELADLADAESELSDIEAMAASFQGGPDGDDSANEGDAQ